MTAGNNQLNVQFRLNFAIWSFFCLTCIFRRHWKEIHLPVLFFDFLQVKVFFLHPLIFFFFNPISPSNDFQILWHAACTVFFFRIFRKQNVLSKLRHIDYTLWWQRTISRASFAEQSRVKCCLLWPRRPSWSEMKSAVSPAVPGLSATRRQLRDANPR